MENRHERRDPRSSSNRRDDGAFRESRGDRSYRNGRGMRGKGRFRHEDASFRDEEYQAKRDEGVAYVPRTRPRMSENVNSQVEEGDSSERYASRSGAEAGNVTRERGSRYGARREDDFSRRKERNYRERDDSDFDSPRGRRDRDGQGRFGSRRGESGDNSATRYRPRTAPLSRDITEINERDSFSRVDGGSTRERARDSYGREARSFSSGAGSNRRSRREDASGDDVRSRFREFSRDYEQEELRPNRFGGRPRRDFESARDSRSSRRDDDNRWKGSRDSGGKRWNARSFHDESRDEGFARGGGERYGKRRESRGYSQDERRNRSRAVDAFDSRFSESVAEVEMDSPRVLKRVRKPLKRETSGTQPQQLKPIDLTSPIRLNRFIAQCGTCSRRDADELIAAGQVTVNGAVVTTLGTRVVPADSVIVCQGKTLSLERKVYILLNKPKDCFCTTDDPHAGRTVLDLIEGACTERVYPVGRLDRNTTGLLLLTNDGELTEQLTHPSYAKCKIYEVQLDRNVAVEDMEHLLAGVETELGTVAVDRVEYTEDGKDTVGVEIHSGQNRIVRRLFEALNYQVKRLDRVYYAGLTKRNLPRGQWRFLTPEEVGILRSGRYE